MLLIQQLDRKHIIMNLQSQEEATTKFFYSLFYSGRL